MSDGSPSSSSSVLLIPGELERTNEEEEGDRRRRRGDRARQEWVEKEREEKAKGNLMAEASFVLL